MNFFCKNQKNIAIEKQKIEEKLNNNLRFPNSFKKYSLNFHLINSDPQFYKINWNFEKVKQNLLLPFLSKISSIFTFEIENINSDLKFFGNLDPTSFKIKNEILKNKFLAPKYDPDSRKFKVYGSDLQNIHLENQHWIIRSNFFLFFWEIHSKSQLTIQQNPQLTAIHNFISSFISQTRNSILWKSFPIHLVVISTLRVEWKEEGVLLFHNLEGLCSTTQI